MRRIRFVSILFITALIIGGITCGGGEQSPSESHNHLPTAISPTSTPEAVTITIGNLTDVTGVASNATEILTMALEDTVDYYNERDKIPGVKLEVRTYDCQYDPAKDIPGYEWLKNQGADLIWSPVAQTGITLKPILEADKMVMILMSPSQEAFDPPGWVFAMGQARYDEQMYTLLDWIAENDPDFPKDRPAKMGGAMLNEAAGQAVLESAESYARNNSEYEWAGSYLVHFTFQWDSQAEALKDCDYVFPAVPPQSFVKDYHEAGGKGIYLGPYALAAFMAEVDKLDLWDEMDGTCIISPFRWWTDDTEYGRLTTLILHDNHPSQSHEIMRAGAGYITVQPVVMLLEAIRETVEMVGPQNFSSEDLYNHLQSFSMTVDGCRHSFSETKRTSNDFLNIHRFDAERKDLFLAHEGWIPIKKEP